MRHLLNGIKPSLTRLIGLVDRGHARPVAFEGNQGGVMADKSPRRLKLEQSLAEDPSDTFLRYGLALQCLREGDLAEGRSRLLALIADHPDNQVAAYQQLGQSYLEAGESHEASATLRAGIARAQAQRDWHAAAEMEGLLAQLG
jgi:predicted Zn-dependent protease